MNKTILILTIAFAGSILIFVQQKQAVSSKNYTINNCVNTLDTTKLEKTKVGAQYWFANKNFADGKTIKLSVVEPGKATHAPHTHVDDEFWYILEGNATFYLGNDSITVSTNTTLYAPSNVRHGIKNTGKTVLKYLVIREYKSEEKK